jgi:hypothetical protein
MTRTHLLRWQHPHAINLSLKVHPVFNLNVMVCYLASIRSHYTTQQEGANHGSCTNQDFGFRLTATSGL